MAILHYRDKVQISHEIWREFLSGSWKYWSNLRTPPSASFGGGGTGGGALVFKVIFSCIVSAFVL